LIKHIFPYSPNKTKKGEREGREGTKERKVKEIERER
jgi:hypothetical protein